MLTRLEILKEYAMCLDNPTYAIETYLETFDKTQEGFVPFKLFPRQLEIIDAYNTHRFNLVTKPRQAGVSTTTAAFMTIKVGFADPKNPEAVLIIANKQELAFEFLGKIKAFMLQLPRWIWGSEYYGSPEKDKKSIFVVDAKKEIKLPNGSRVKAVATSKDALRGFTPTYLIMDEAAYIDKGDEVFGAALTALGTGGKACLISTPNGMDPLYHKTYEQAMAGDNDFNIIEMKWYEDLRYNKDLRWIKKIKKEVDGVEIDDILEDTEYEFTFSSYAAKIKDGFKPTSTWYEEMCRGMNNDKRMIAQELDVSFIGSGGNVIAEEDIEWQNVHNVIEPIRKESDNEIWIWEDPQPDHRYIMGVDVARGDGKDSSTISIIDVTTMTQVLEYKGKTPPDLLAVLVEELGNKYEAYTVVDITGGMGVATVLKLLEFEYKFLHYDTPNGKIFSSQQSKIQAYKKDGKVPGLGINTIRTPMISNFEEKIRNHTFIVRSKRSTSEMKTFVYKNGRADHSDGFHDDLIFANAMCLWVIEHAFKQLTKVKNQSKAMLTAWGGKSLSDPEPKKQYVSNSIKPKTSNDKPKPNLSRFIGKNVQDPEGKYLWLFSGTR
jgi:hypothetical protein